MKSAEAPQRRFQRVGCGLTLPTRGATCEFSNEHLIWCLQLRLRSAGAFEHLTFNRWCGEHLTHSPQDAVLADRHTTPSCGVARPEGFEPPTC